MAVKVVLTQDKNKGPGYGLLTISGLSAVNNLTLRFESNQINKEHLQPNGQWSASQASHDCILLERNENSVVVGLEPNTIDALLKNTHATYRIIVTYDGHERISPLRIPHNFLGSGAIQITKPVVEEQELILPPPPEIEQNIAEPSPEPDENEDSQNASNTDECKKSNLVIILIAAFIALTGLGLAIGWYFCLIPALPPGPACQTVNEGTAEQTPNEQSGSLTTTNAALNLYEEALALQKNGALIKAKTKFQKAATEEEHADAMKRLAEMYDPNFWSKDISPAKEANWETANWWWEKAADKGDVDALRRSGYNMAKYSNFDVEKRKGLSILKDLADNNDSQAQEMQKEINGE